jgi:tetratricopeptide (TPR) repeat protein
MSAPVELKYRAFLSYAHADMRWGKRLHSALEGFRFDKDLVGRTTPLGIVPQSLRPIFRDREDFSGGHLLNDATIAALDASAALIVLCSTVSATRPTVNEEVRLFRARHPDRSVIPVILDGRFPDNFPPALRCELAADGTITDRPVTILGPDVRESGDGRDLAVAKVVAGLTGLAPDEIYRRAERQRRRRTNIRNAVIAMLTLLVIAATGSAVYAWQQLKTNEAFLEATLKSATEIVSEAVAQAEKYNVPRAATMALLTRAEGLFDNMARYGRSTPSLQRQKAWMLIEFARNYKILGDTTRQLQRAEEAHRIMTVLANASGSDHSAQRDLMVAHGERGSVLVAQGNLPAALESYRAAQAIAERLAKADPANAVASRDLSVSHNKIGDVLRDQGNLPAALESFRAALAIGERLAKADAGNAWAGRDLGVSHDRIGNVHRAQGNLPAALESYGASLAIAERLAKADPANAGASRDHSVSHSKIGDVLVDQGNLPAALESFRAALAIAERLAKLDAANVDWQRGLSMSLERIGDVLRAQGNLAEASQSYRTSLAIKERLAMLDAGNAVRQHDVALSLQRVGFVAAQENDIAAARAAYERGHRIMQTLVRLAPDHTAFKQDLAWFEARLVGLK